jgi:hypothetical protein
VLSYLYYQIKLTDMNHEGVEGGMLDLDSENLRRLSELMRGADELAMEDLLSFLSPEQAKAEIDILENKLRNLKTSRENVIETFKKHLEYLAL